MTDLIDSCKAKPRVFNPSQSQPDLYAAWQHFFANGEVHRHIVSDDIAESWLRSRAYRIIPDLIPENAYANSEQYRQQIHQYDWIQTLASPILKNLFDFLGRSGCIISLYSPQGCALIRLGQPSDIRLHEQLGLKPELCFDESLVGTAGFNLALRQCRCVRIVGAEHYLKPLHSISGVYTPVLDRSQLVLGVIGVENIHELVCPQTESILRSTTHAIENLITLDRLKTENFVYRQSLQITTDSLDNGFILLDGDGYVQEINPAAYQILQCRPKTISTKQKANIIDLKPVGESLIKTLQSAKTRSGPVHFQVDGKTYQMQTNCLQQHDTGTEYILIQLNKPISADPLLRPHQRSKPVYTLNSIIGTSAAIDEVKKLALTAASTEAPVIIEGESGTGKELVAQSIHNASARKSAPFIAINCAAVPSELIESIIFGHQKGAFTGASRNHIGKFESAHNGTLFLDEIADMSLTMQAKILRAIEGGIIERIGDDRPIAVNVRLIAASNKNLLNLIQQNHFRKDLFYRLNVFRIALPPLRERIEDTADLVRFFVDELILRFKNTSIEISAGYLRCLQSYHWPGNVRELRNAVHYSMARLSGPRLNADHLIGFFPHQQRYQVQDRLAPDDDQILSRQEARIISDALLRHHGNKTITAKALGISRATLYRKLKAIRALSIGG